MTVRISGQGLTIEDVVAVARHHAKVELTSDALERMRGCRGFLDRKIEANEVMYGVNTGIGEFSEVALSPGKLRDFQRYLVYNHSAGIGAPAPLDHVRAAMLSRVNVHAHGNSGCRPVVTQTLVEMLNRDVTPLVCEKGSVGACGDLAPMSQVALTLIGEGEAFYKGERMPAQQAMKKAGLDIITFEARDGLAVINGSNLTTGIGALLVYEVERWLKQADIATAMTLDALGANLRPYDRRLHELRGFPGAVASAANIRQVLEGGDLVVPGKVKTRVQDAYSLRSTPQVIGAARDHLKWARAQVEIELNGVGDNPIFLPEDGEVLTGANFQGTPVSLPLDMVGASVTMISVLSERRLNRLLNPALSAGLPDFLTKDPGPFSGFMLSQYTADALIVEQRILSMPACVQSIPAAADQEDFVSMGMNTALKTRQIVDNAYGVLGIELMAASQAIEFRQHKPGRGTAAAKGAVRERVSRLEEDRPLFPDHNAMSALVREGAILQAVESAVGELRTYGG